MKVNERSQGHCRGKGSDEATAGSSVKFPHRTNARIPRVYTKKSKPAHHREDTCTHGYCSATNIDQDVEFAQLSIHKQMVHILCGTYTQVGFIQP